MSSSSGFEQVPAETAFGTVPDQIVHSHVKNNLTIDKCGYFYVYVSNETPNIDVFFDNLQVTHIGANFGGDALLSIRVDHERHQ